MILKEVALTNFRNYSEREFLFSPETTLIVGPNTSGKTNLIEAICVLSTGKSLRASVELELIQWGKSWGRVEAALRPDPAEEEDPEEKLARKKARLLRISQSLALGNRQLGDSGSRESAERTTAADLGTEKKLEVFIGANESNNHTRKQFKINGVKKDLGEFQGSFRVVIFSPESLRLILGSPSHRRDYLNRVLSSLDSSYFRALDEYQKVIRNRNQLLWLIREKGVPQERLEFWDEKLFSLGGEIFEKRKELFADLNQKFSDLRLGIGLSYKPSVLDKGFYAERLPQEIEKAATLWGPHRDDALFLRKQIQTDKVTDLSRFGSRGEQREAVFALTLAELEVVSERVGERPILLLDDIFSELDGAHRQRVLEVLPKQQTVITSAEPELLDSGLVSKAKLIRLG